MSMQSPSATKARALGINHIALEVDDVNAALDFYGQIVEFSLRGRHEGMAFIDLGDQFIALTEKRTQEPDKHRHFGLVVDDKAMVKKTLEALNIETLPGAFLDFIDPWGNRVQIVQYSEIQFTKAPHVLRGMGIKQLDKSDEAVQALAEKGMAPE
ncbi:Glyoxalase/bleomycin resistance protein/dioxygenase [Nitrosococcus oceani ATCC 19707]|uniref:Glyoxalase/bleomycin resistance protein/dioxygenase n=2 Tax=Nitrosococcus oceani TaxID=1229 RepID=Q3J7I2_NITOC|nr:VOC family protein [Nitrosococcus oceani]ABA59214.1 Glyoxalase/bleomycin resistance protein/dioxygenase [Nitrosococcus oceani ATCC 19707]EDZ65557.1 glyoxalase family protein [Nitrosococcus oceani AFC27]KFI18385.1 extradiol dioxygenase [Nitrosococcus oceani C-27]GEM20250.1 extradiol dioxygenase [Nitrosococcus oceani]